MRTIHYFSSFETQILGGPILINDLDIRIIHSDTCCICLSNIPNYIIRECGHVCLCESCASQLVLTDCPLCKAKIENPPISVSNTENTTLIRFIISHNQAKGVIVINKKSTVGELKRHLDESYPFRRKYGLISILNEQGEEISQNIKMIDLEEKRIYLSSNKYQKHIYIISPGETLSLKFCGILNVIEGLKKLHVDPKQVEMFDHSKLPQTVNQTTVFMSKLERNSPQTLFVKFISGKTVNLRVYSDSTVLEVKLRIYLKEHISPCDQRLIFAGKQLQDEQTLADYKIPNEATFHLVLRVSGC
jgi:hypothetical protein